MLMYISSGEGAEDLHLELFRQVRDDGLVGLEPPRNEGGVDVPEALCCIRVMPRLYGDEIGAPEFALRAGKSGV